MAGQNQALPIMYLLLPRNSDIRGQNSLGGPDTIVVPTASNRRYNVLWVDDVAKGFGNEHRIAVLQQQVPFYLDGGPAQRFALQFDGATTNIDINNPAALQITGAITVAAWAWFTPGVGGTIVSKFDTTTGFGYQLSATAAGAAGTFGGTGGTAGAVIASSALQGLHHVAAVWDGVSAVNGFLDGLSVGFISPFSGPLSDSTLHAFIGAQTTSPGPTLSNWFFGKIDGVRIYNVALTPLQILEIYGGGYGLGVAGSAAAGLVAWYRLDEGTGTTAIDSSATANNGTENGSPIYQPSLILG